MRGHPAKSVRKEAKDGLLVRAAVPSAAKEGEPLSTLATSWVGSHLATETAASLESRLDEGLDSVGLPQRLINALEKAGIVTVRDLLGRRREEILAIRNVGRLYIRQIFEALRRIGFIVPGEFSSMPKPKRVSPKPGRSSPRGRPPANAQEKRVRKRRSVAAQAEKTAEPAESPPARLSAEQALERCVTELQPVVEYVAAMLGAEDPLTRRLQWILHYAATQEAYSAETEKQLSQAASTPEVASPAYTVGQVVELAKETAAPAPVDVQIVAQPPTEIPGAAESFTTEETVPAETNADAYEFDDQFDEDFVEEFDDEEEAFGIPLEDEEGDDEGEYDRPESDGLMLDDEEDEDEDELPEAGLAMEEGEDSDSDLLERYG